MYLHIGQSKTVAAKSVVGVFDLDNASTSRITRAFLERAQADGRLVPLGDELPLSIVVCREGGSCDVVYLSPISPRTLLSRALDG